MPWKELRGLTPLSIVRLKKDDAKYVKLAHLARDWPCSRRPANLAPRPSAGSSLAAEVLR